MSIYNVFSCRTIFRNWIFLTKRICYWTKERKQIEREMIYICMSSLSTILLIFYFIYLCDFQIAFKNKESSAFLFVSNPFRYIWYRIIQRWRTFVNFYENTSLEISSPRLLSAMIKVNLSCFQMSKFSWEFRSKTLPTFSKAHFPFLNSLLQHFLSSRVSWHCSSPEG